MSKVTMTPDLCETMHATLHAKLDGIAAGIGELRGDVAKLKQYVYLGNGVPPLTVRMERLESASSMWRWVWRTAIAAIIVALVGIAASEAKAQDDEQTRYYLGTTLLKSITQDAFGRDRVSMPVTLFEAASLYDANPDYTTFISGNGAVAYTTNKSAVTLSLSSGRVSRISKRWLHYQPGKSQLLLVTGCFNGACPSGLVKRVGLINPLTREGLYMEQDHTGVYFVRAGAATNRIAQTNWLVQPNNLDWNNTFGLAIDAEWLGIGRVRYALFSPQSGETQYSHMLLAANLTNTVYTRSLDLPVVYEIAGTAATTGTLDAICASVSSEGGQDDAGRSLTAASGVTPTVIGNVTGNLAVVGVRLDATKPGTTLRVESLRTACGTASPSGYRWSLIRDPTLTTSVTWAAVGGSTVQMALGGAANYATGGEVIASGYASEVAAVGDVTLGWSTPPGYIAITNNGALALRAETLWLCVQRVAPAASAENYYGSVQVREVR